jgi:hypothetical protein
MAIPPGSYTLGPESGTLTVKTTRTGAAAKAGHDLVIEVTAWQATLEVGDASSIALDADPKSLRVREGKGGMQKLGDDEKANIEQTIDDEVLRGTPIEFRSTEVTSSDAGIGVRGALMLGGTTSPIAFDVDVGPDGSLRASAVVTQSEWGIAPYSTLFGTLKVVDEVEVVLDALLPTS